MPYPGPLPRLIRRKFHPIQLGQWPIPGRKRRNADRRCPKRAAGWALRNMVNNWYLSLTAGRTSSLRSLHAQTSVAPELAVRI
jgi:hypothetical protein